MIDDSDRFLCANQNTDSKKDFLFFLWDQSRILQPQIVAEYTAYLFSAIWSFFTQDFYFLICFACVYINVEIFIYTLFQYQGNNTCNKLVITLIFMDYVYNLECIMCLRREKKKEQQTSQIFPNTKPS